jgi:hypothetical protein
MNEVSPTLCRTPDPSSRALFLLIAIAESWTSEILFDWPRPPEELWNAPTWLLEDTDPEGVLLDELKWPFCWLVQLPDITRAAMTDSCWVELMFVKVQDDEEGITRERRRCKDRVGARKLQWGETIVC